MEAENTVGVDLVRPGLHVQSKESERQNDGGAQLCDRAAPDDEHQTDQREPARDTGVLDAEQDAHESLLHSLA